jgi:small subunit ribosomal protein S16
LSVKLRLRRGGRKKHPVYRIVAIDSRKRRDGKYIEKVGFYDPNPEPAIIEINREKALKWLSDGAIPSDTVKSFLKRDGIMHEFSFLKRGLENDQIIEEMKKWEILQLEKQKKLEAQAAMAKRDKEAKKEPKQEEKAPVEESVAKEAPETKAESNETSESPVAEEPVAEEPAAEKPVADEQVADESVAEEPVAEVVAEEKPQDEAKAEASVEEPPAGPEKESE